MSLKKTYNSFSETKQDFKISWKLFKENWKAFISTIFFAGFFLLICAIILFIIAQFIPHFFISEFTRIFTSSFTRIFTFLSSFLVILFGVIVFFAFLSCQYGLAFDIMSSGDMFAEFKGSFTYFRRHWWQYSILSLFTSWGIFVLAGSGPFFSPGRRVNIPPLPVIPPLPINLDPLQATLGFIFGEYFAFFIYFFLFIAFISSFPIITAKGKNKNKRISGVTLFKNSIINSFRIFKKIPKRLIYTWGIYFLIFIIPLNIFIIIANAISNSFYLSIGNEILIRLIQTLWLCYILIGSPMMALLATRIINSVELEDNLKNEVSPNIENN